MYTLHICTVPSWLTNASDKSTRGVSPHIIHARKMDPELPTGEHMLGFKIRPSECDCR